MCHHAWLIFAFLVEMGFHHVRQADLKLLGLSDPPTSASQNASALLCFLYPSLLPFTYMLGYVCVCAIYTQCLTPRDQEGSAKSTWNLLLKAGKTDSRKVVLGNREVA